MAETIIRHTRFLGELIEDAQARNKARAAATHGDNIADLLSCLSTLFDPEARAKARMPKLESSHVPIAGMDVLQDRLAASGESLKDIADDLGLSVRDLGEILRGRVPLNDNDIDLWQIFALGMRGGVHFTVDIVPKEGSQSSASPGAKP